MNNAIGGCEVSEPRTGLLGASGPKKVTTCTRRQSFAQIQLKSIGELVGKNFWVPKYQRGYRWTEQQVNDLLNDIEEFMGKDNPLKNINEKDLIQTDSFYCLQPLVVSEEPTQEFRQHIQDALQLPDNQDLLEPIRRSIMKDVRWEVIDGQQRLTTIFLLLQVLDPTHDSFALRYERWKGKDIASIIGGLSETDAETNIDYLNLWNAQKTIKAFFKGHKNDSHFEEDFKATLLHKVQFIWYESYGENPIKVFTRLNIGKIGLTNAELVKALFLNRANFDDNDCEKTRLRQIEIAARWDEMESTLQDEEFWLFLHTSDYGSPTRIEYLFDLMCKKGMIDDFIDKEKLGEGKKKLGHDAYRTFRYFNAFFHSKQAKEASEKDDKTPIEFCWDKVDSLFSTFKEWFDDSILYHYIGFLIAQKENYIDDILEQWNKANDKSVFLDSLEKMIRKHIANCNCANLGAQYTDSTKRQCLPILLLYNVQTSINLNARNIPDGEMSQYIFYKFPFYLYKIEGWDVEHIDSRTDNDLTNKDGQNEYLLNRYNAVREEIQKQIESFINNPNPPSGSFEALKERTDSFLGEGTQDRLSEESGEKEQIWNYALLDSSTNRSYGNAIFSAKRRIIIGKDRGRALAIPRLTIKDGHSHLDFFRESTTKEISPFIPPCTKRVFFKYFNSVLTDPNYWLRVDAIAYRNDIFETLKQFGVTKPSLES